MTNISLIQQLLNLQIKFKSRIDWWRKGDDLPLILVVNKYSCDYAGCGSHQMELKVTMNLEEIILLLKQIEKLCSENK